MSSIQKRFLLFLGGCIPARLALVAAAKYMPINYLPYMSIFTLLIAIGFIYLFSTGKRTTGLETQGAPIWWMKYRIIHGLLYLLFSYMAFMKNTNAYLVLLGDVIIGLILFLFNHYSSGNFSKLF